MSEDRLIKMRKCEGEHMLDVYFCEETPIEDSYWFGVCSRCGLSMELPIKQIEEVFNG